MNIKYLTTSLIVGCALSSLSFAQTEPSGTASAEHWLSLQRDQSLASTQAQAASALAREKSMERLFKTYDQPIPDKYFSDSFKSGQ